MVWVLEFAKVFVQVVYVELILHLINVDQSLFHYLCERNSTIQIERILKDLLFEELFVADGTGEFFGTDVGTVDDRRVAAVGNVLLFD
jgi:hypothetical protein